MPKRKPFLFLIFTIAVVIFIITTGPAAAANANVGPDQFEETALPLVGPGAGPGIGSEIEVEGQVHGLYFYSEDCTHCYAIQEEVLKPLQNEYGIILDIRFLEIGTPENYELLINLEEYFKVATADRAIPTLLIGEDLLIGEGPIREKLPTLVSQAVEAGGLDWPVYPFLDLEALTTSQGLGGSPPPELCGPDNPEACEQGQPIYAAYYYKVGCQECSRVEADIKYLKSKYPQFITEEFNIFDSADMAQWMATRVGRENFEAPGLFIGEDALLGDSELSPASIEELLIKYQENGADKFWEDYDPEQGNLVDRFRSMGWVAVVFAGLVDGLNPCAFATLIFFVSYLTLSGRKGREVLLVGGAFTFGVFIAYLLVGFGFYKVLDLLGTWLTVLGKWVYGLTAVFCFVLAFFAFRDFLKARKGDIGDMSLSLPHALRMRINAIIRKGRNESAYVVGAFTAGILISFLELACTGQIYLPTIIFMRSVPELSLKANLFLLLYNALFVAPLIVVFILAYYGTTSKDLTNFLQKNAAAVKLGMVVLFLGLGTWLALSLLA